jgi:hypothetical protein
MNTIIMITQQFVLTYFVTTYGEKYKMVWPAVTKPASATFMGCLVQKHRKNHTEKSDFSNVQVSKKAEVSFSLLFIRIFTVTVSDPRKEKCNQINVGCRSTK